MGIFESSATLLNNTLIKLVSFVTILIFGLVIGRFIGKLVYKILNELEIGYLISKKFKITADIEKIAGNFFKYGIYLISFFYAFNRIGVSKNIFFYFLIIILIGIILFLILEIKDYVQNLVIGLFLIDRNFLKIGQRIKIKKIEGFIVKISSTEIKLITDKNDTYFIPNKVLMRSSLFNKVDEALKR